MTISIFRAALWSLNRLLMTSNDSKYAWRDILVWLTILAMNGISVGVFCIITVKTYDDLFFAQKKLNEAGHVLIHKKKQKRNKWETHPASASVLEEGRQPTWTPSEAPDPERGQQAEWETKTNVKKHYFCARYASKHAHCDARLRRSGAKS